MEITLEKEDQKARLNINLVEDDYKPKVAEKLKEYGKKANLKGFRPGKVPISLMQKMYGKSILVEEINHLISHSINDYIKSNKLNIVGDPLPSDENDQIDWENQKEFQFSFNIGLVPEFSLTLDNLEATKYTIAITDEIINETVDNLKSQFGEMADTDTVEEGDFLTGDVKEVNGDYLYENASFSSENIKKGELKKFVGKKKGDKVTFDIQNTFEDIPTTAAAVGMANEEAEKATGDFECTLKTIKRKIPAEINQDFFDKVFGKDIVTSEEAFRNKLKETVEENYKRETAALLTRDLEDRLLKQTEVNIPDTFVKTWLLETNKKEYTQEAIDKQYDRFKKELKWNLIRNQIVEQEGLKAEHEEIVEKAKEYITQQFGNIPMSGEMEETMNKIAENYLKQDNGKPYMQIFETILTDKALAFIKGKTKIKDKTISLEEFKKLANIES